MLHQRTSDVAPSRWSECCRVAVLCCIRQPLRVKQRVPTFLSLFSGCGGLDLGFLAAGYECLQAFDIDGTSVDTYNYNIAGSRASVADLSSTCVDRARPDVVVAGPPCQGFSTVGRRDHADTRNHLLLRPVDVAIASGARVLLLENVCGALSGAHASYWKEAVQRLRRHGYSTATLRVTASAAGLPQVRRRAVLVAGRASFNPLRIKLPNEQPVLRSVLDVPHSTANHSPTLLDPSSRSGRIAARIRPGQKLSNVRNGSTSVHTWEIPTVFGRVSKQERALLECLLVLRRRRRVRNFGDADPVPFSSLRARFGHTTRRLVESLVSKDYIRQCGPSLFDLRRTFNGKFRRLALNLPAHCVVTKFCDPTHFLHPSENRAFTVREAARIQGFPDSFRFFGSHSQQATQVGNAVPPPIAAMFARWIQREFL